jgi:alkylhydroperoxidase family enzyme
VRAVLQDWRTAPVQAPLRATLGFLQKLCQAPGAVAASDIIALRSAGIGDEAIHDAVYVGLVFDLAVRLADALGFTVPPPESLVRAARAKVRQGKQH